MVSFTLRSLMLALLAAGPACAEPPDAPLPAGALLRIGTMRYRHACGPNNAALSSDGRMLATTNESHIILWDVASGKPLHILRNSEVPNGFGLGKSLVSFSPDGATLASVAGQHAVFLWDVSTGHRRDQFPIQGVSSVRYTPNGKELVVQSPNGVETWNLSSRQQVRNFAPGSQPRALTPDGKSLLVKTQAGLELIDWKNGKTHRQFATKGEPAAALSRDGTMLATASDGNLLRLWDTESGQERWSRKLGGPEAKPGMYAGTVLAFTIDGKELFLGTATGGIRRWNVAEGVEMAALTGHLEKFVTGLHPTPDGKLLISVGWDCMIRRWDLATGQELPHGDGYVAYLHVAPSPDGRFVALSDATGRLEWRDLGTGKLIRTLAASGPHRSRLAVSPDGKTLAAGGRDAALVLWDTGTGRELRQLKPDGAETAADWFEGVEFSRDGKTLVGSSRQNGMRAWEPDSGKQLWHRSESGPVAISPDSQRLLHGGWDRKLTICAAATGAVIREADPATSIDSIAFSPDGSRLATSQRSGRICLRDPQTGAQRKLIDAYDDVIWRVSFSPDGEWIAGGESRGHRVRVWEVESGVELAALTGHEGRVYHSEFLPDFTILSAADDLTALRWSLRPPRGPKPDLDTLWTDLAGEPKPGFAAVWAFANDPAAAAEFLRKRLAPESSPLDIAKVARRIGELDASNFTQRETASKELTNLGRPVVGRLRAALADAASPEKRRRLQALIDP